jgi:hypothetical protein
VSRDGHDEALQEPLSCERPIVLLMHVIHDLIGEGLALTLVGRRSIIMLLEALQCLVTIKYLGRLDRDEIDNFLTHSSARIGHDLERG